MPSLGEELRNLREQHDMSIEEIAQRTRISKRYLEYIEHDRYELLPGGAFNRAFLRTYANIVGMNPQEALQRYSELAPPAREKARGSEPALHKHRPLIRFVMSTVLTLTLFTLGSIFIYREIKSARSQMEEARSAAKSVPDLSLVPPTTPPPAEAPQQTLSVGTPTEAKPQTTAPEYPLNLVIEATNQCWISVSADGRQITSQLLARGDKLRFNANNQFTLILGNAGGVNLRVNGLQLRRPGTSGEVKRLILTLENYKEYQADSVSPQP